MHSTLGFTTYEVVEHVSNSTFNKFFVTYDAVSREVKCQCLWLESRDIMCQHSLNVLSFERVYNVATKYILECCSKNIKKRHTHINCSQDEPLLELKSTRFDDLVFWSHNICEFALESKELTGILHRVFDNVMAEMQEYQARSKGKSLFSHKEATLSDVNDLQSLPHVRTRGRSKNRQGSNLKKRKSQLQARSTIQLGSSLYNAQDINFPERITGVLGSRWLRESYDFRFLNHLFSDFVNFLKENVWTIFAPEGINFFLQFN
ncbi:hypothetical protein Ahy_A03g013742 [Arachis hypogaea]|uniref:Protein FAR1-RELATED SEQUENCE n=1 Tax=Arachis hypogaea TaxID=3818 RepID=A0A445DW41_ARAHY|nr:hypothetical protein Ahy_A03g013742 [Arachis hypogaea]